MKELFLLLNKNVPHHFDKFVSVVSTMICEISSRLMIWMLTTYSAKANFWIRRPTVCIIVTKETDSCPRMATNTIIWNRVSFESFFFCNHLLGKPWHGPFPGIFPLKTKRSPIFLPPSSPPSPSHVVNIDERSFNHSFKITKKGEKLAESSSVSIKLKWAWNHFIF